MSMNGAVLPTVRADQPYVRAAFINPQRPEGDGAAVSFGIPGERERSVTSTQKLLLAHRAKRYAEGELFDRVIEDTIWRKVVGDAPKNQALGKAPWTYWVVAAFSAFGSMEVAFHPALGLRREHWAILAGLWDIEARFEYGAALQQMHRPMIQRA